MRSKVIRLIVSASPLIGLVSCNESLCSRPDIVETTLGIVADQLIPAYQQTTAAERRGLYLMSDIVTDRQRTNAHECSATLSRNSAATQQFQEKYKEFFNRPAGWAWVLPPMSQSIRFGYRVQKLDNGGIYVSIIAE